MRGRLVLVVCLIALCAEAQLSSFDALPVLRQVAASHEQLATLFHENAGPKLRALQTGPFAGVLQQMQLLAVAKAPNIVSLISSNANGKPIEYGKKILAATVGDFAVLTPDCVFCAIMISVCVVEIVVRSIVAKITKTHNPMNSKFSAFADYLVCFAFVLAWVNLEMGCTRRYTTIVGALMISAILFDFLGVGKRASTAPILSFVSMQNLSNKLFVIFRTLRTIVLLLGGISAITHGAMRTDNESAGEGKLCGIFHASCQLGLTCNVWSQCTQSFMDPYAGPHVSGFALQRWMAKYPGRKLRELFLIGTHHSGANWRVREVENQIVDVHLFDTCQQDNIDEQLAMGVRFMDFRVALHRNRTVTRTEDLRFVDVHGLCYGPVKPKLEMIKHFLQSNPTESVIVKLGFGNAMFFADAIGESWKLDEAASTDLFLRTLSPYVYDACAEGDPRTKTLKELAGKAIIFKGNHPVCRNGRTHSSGLILDSYDSCVDKDPAIMSANSRKWLEEHSWDAKVLHLQHIIAASPDSISQHYLKTIFVDPFMRITEPNTFDYSLATYTKECNALLLSNILSRETPLTRGIGTPVAPMTILVDFVNNDILNAVDQLNSALNITAFRHQFALRHSDPVERLLIG